MVTVLGETLLGPMDLYNPCPQKTDLRDAEVSIGLSSSLSSSVAQF